MPGGRDTGAQVSRRPYVVKVLSNVDRFEQRGREESAWPTFARAVQETHRCYKTWHELVEDPYGCFTWIVVDRRTGKVLYDLT